MEPLTRGAAGEVHASLRERDSTEFGHDGAHRLCQTRTRAYNILDFDMHWSMYVATLQSTCVWR